LKDDANTQTPNPWVCMFILVMSEVQK